ncbi:MAG: hypothetical protein U5R31_04980 [Acidimicrobiia bacterium]|nr:hypothetical protein [Acidimicrobiia bacterium]
MFDEPAADSPEAEPLIEKGAADGGDAAEPVKDDGADDLEVD